MAFIPVYVVYRFNHDVYMCELSRFKPISRCYIVFVGGIAKCSCIYDQLKNCSSQLLMFDS